MDSLRKLSQYFSCFLLFFFFFFMISFSNSYSAFAMPRLHRFKEKIHVKQDLTSKTSSSDNPDMKISYYSQTLDHFNYRPESYTTFKQKYMINSKYWGGAKAMSPILAFLGDEAPLLDSDGSNLLDYAAHLRALIVVIEHRFYGKSKPFGMSSMEEVVRNASIRGYFNSAQAIADYAELILHLKKSFKAHYSPVIVFGGSYGGMLAAWFRLKYPHVAVGALASSAPILYFDNIISPNKGYYYIVSKDFKETSESCYNTIKKSWSKIDEIASKSNGLSFLTKKFKTCTPVKNGHELKDYLDSLYTYLAQYSSPSVICKAIDKGSKGRDVLSRIYAGIVEFFGDINCYDTKYWDDLFDDETNVGYPWQICSEMVMPIVDGTNNDSMFPRETFNLSKFISDCKKKYNVLPRPHWITTYYGGHDIKLVLKRFGSNIIFSNGLKDPYSSAGVLEDLNDSIFAVYTENGTHCEDINMAQENDPKWLKDQRRKEFEIIEGWIKQYYTDLKHYLK